MNNESSEFRNTVFLSDAPASDDFFGLHDQVAKSLIEFCSKSTGINPPFVIGVFGPWGSGKSTLLEIFENQCAKNTLPILPIRIDAWKQTQHSFLRALLGTLGDKLHLSEKDKKSFELGITSKETTQNKGWKLGVKAHRWITIFVVFSVLLLLLSIIFTPLEIAVPDWVLRFVLAAFVIYVGQIVLTTGKREITTTSEPLTLNDPDFFREKLTALLRMVKDKHVCVVVDNLDRCAPDEAIEIMRLIKTFMVDEKEGHQLSFIVACDDAVLEKHLEDSLRLKKEKEEEKEKPREYLRKFFNITLTLPGIHRSDMHRYIDEQLHRAFDDPAAPVKLSSQQYRNIRNIIYTCFSGTPRQVKRFINKLLARLYVLKAQEESGRIEKVKPTQYPEACALYLALVSKGQEGATGLFALRSGTVKSNELKELANLNLHQTIPSDVWAAIDLLIEPEKRHTLPALADLTQAFEVDDRSTFKKRLGKLDKEEATAHIEELLLELKSRGFQLDIKQRLISYLFDPSIRELIEPSETIAHFITSYLDSADIEQEWERAGPGDSIGYYLKPYREHVSAALSKLLQSGDLAPKRISENYLFELLESILDVADKRQLEGIWSRSLAAFPSLLRLAKERPETIWPEHVAHIANHWQSQMACIADLLKVTNQDTRTALKEAALQWPFADQIFNAQAVSTFANNGGLRLIRAVIETIDIEDKPKLTHLQQFISMLAQFLPQIPEANTREEALCLICAALMKEKEIEAAGLLIEASIKNQLPSWVYQALSNLPEDSINKILGKCIELGRILPRQNLVQIVQHKPKTFDVVMNNYALPDNWYAELFNNAFNLFEQWLDTHWQTLSAENKSKLQQFVLQHWLQAIGQPPSVSPGNVRLGNEHAIALLAEKMPCDNDAALLEQRYTFIATNAGRFLPNLPLNSPQGFEELLKLIDKLTSMRPPIPENTINFVENIRKQVPHNDLSSDAKGLKVKWGKAKKRKRRN